MQNSKKALIVGVANERSLAWAIASKMHGMGFDLAFTYQGENLERRVRPLAESVHSEIVVPCDARSDSDLDQVFEAVRAKWDRLDAVIHSIAFANKEDLEGRFVDTSRSGFLMAIDVSAYTLVALARRAEPLMQAGGSIVTLSYHGAQKVVPNYNVMGVAKAALESAVRYLANDLGPKKITVNAVSAGPVKTLAAMGVRDFRTMLSVAEQKTPLCENISAEDVGELGAFLCGPGGRHITGSTLYVDSGANIMA